MSDTGDIGRDSYQDAGAAMPPPHAGAVADNPAQPSRPASPADAAFRVRRRGIVLTAIFGLTLMLSVLLPAAPEGLPLCLFRSNTGIPCPTCGMTRGFIHMGHGRLSAAYAVNILAPVLFVLTVALFAVASAQAVTARDLLRHVWLRVRRVAIPLIVLLLAVSWAVNIARQFGY